MLNRCKFCYILFISLAVTLFLSVAVTTDAKSAEGLTSGNTNLINCVNCDKQQTTLIDVAGDCDECHKADTAQSSITAKQDVQRMVSLLENQIFAFGRSTDTIYQKDIRYRTVIDTVWHVRQTINHSTTAETMNLISHASALLMQLEREAESGFLVSGNSTTHIRRAIVTLSSTTVPPQLQSALQPTLLTMPNSNSLLLSLELMAVLILSLCILYTVLNRAPPNDHMNCDIAMLNNFLWRVSFIWNALSFVFVPALLVPASQGNFSPVEQSSRRVSTNHLYPLCFSKQAISRLSERV